MLVSKTKPCMSKYRPKIRRNREWLIKSVMVYWILLNPTWITVVILELIHATELRRRLELLRFLGAGGRVHLLDPKVNRPDFGPSNPKMHRMNPNNLAERYGL